MSKSYTLYRDAIFSFIFEVGRVKVKLQQSSFILSSHLRISPLFDNGQLTIDRL
jgi:hypothetical protein